MICNEKAFHEYMIDEKDPFLQDFGFLIIL